ncbi:MAG: transposase [Lactobacillus sp.]|jgi:putative transposase|nr:transposase [Lactobacillus sp.]MCI2033474.1 transposase [Lactobacillus sp.]
MKPKSVDKARKPRFAKLDYHFGIKLVAFPSADQKTTIRHNSDAARFVYNEFVALGREAWHLRRLEKSLFQNQACSTNPGWFEQPIKLVAARLAVIGDQLYNPTHLKRRFKWLDKNKRLDSMMFYATLNFYRASWHMFRQIHSAGVPKFHKKSDRQRYSTLKTNNNIRILDQKHLQIPKLGKIRVVKLPDWLLNRTDIEIGGAAVKMDAIGRYSISLTLGSEQAFKDALPKTGSKVGIDVNVENLLTDSFGEVVENPRFYQKQLQRLHREQRKLGKRAARAKQEHRPLRMAKNYQKQRQVVASLHRRVYNQRQNFLHLVSTALIKNHDLVVVEKLQGKNLLKNHALAQRLQDVGWGILFENLAYKAELYGKGFVQVDPRLTTQTCHRCGFVMGRAGTRKLTLADRIWVCPQCQTKHVRDHNAAINILNKAVA